VAQKAALIGCAHLASAVDSLMTSVVNDFRGGVAMASKRRSERTEE